MPTFFTVLAHCSISTLPISVEPVNVSMRTVGLEVSSAPITPALPVMTLNTPFGMPARSPSSASASAVSGVSDAGLHTTVQPAASAGPTLRVIMAAGKFHGVMAPDYADRLLDAHDTRIGLEGRDGLAVDALGFLGEELDERGGVDDLAPGLGQRLALLAGHQQRQLVGMIHHQVEPAAQDVGALLGQQLGPSGEGALGCRDGGFRALGIDQRHLGDLLAGGRIGDRKRRLADPLAVDVGLALEEGDDLLVHDFPPVLEGSALRTPDNAARSSVGGIDPIRRPPRQRAQAAGRP